MNISIQIEINHTGCPKTKSKNRRLIDYREGGIFQLRKDGQNIQKSMCIEFRMCMVHMNLQTAEAILFTLGKVNYKTG